MGRKSHAIIVVFVGLEVYLWRYGKQRNYTADGDLVTMFSVPG